MKLIIDHIARLNEPSYRMEVDLEILCNLVGSKVQVQGQHGWVYKNAYSLKQLRHLFSLMILDCSAEQIEQSKQYFKEHNKKCASEFDKYLAKVGKNHAL